MHPDEHKPIPAKGTKSDAIGCVLIMLISALTTVAICWIGAWWSVSVNR